MKSIIGYESRSWLGFVFGYLWSFYFIYYYFYYYFISGVGDDSEVKGRCGSLSRKGI